MLLIGIIVISSFSIGYITSILISNSTPNGDTPNGDAPKFYIAIDNMWLTTGTGNTGEPRPVSSTLRGGMTQTQTASTDYHETYIRFNLIDKPNNWNKVEVSLYKYSFYKQYNAPTIWVDLFEGWAVYDEDFWFLKEIKIEDDKGVARSCLIIAIAQTERVVGVKDEKDRYSYPIRIETGKENGDLWKLEEQKFDVSKNNYDFLKGLQEFLK